MLPDVFSPQTSSPPTSLLAIRWWREWELWVVIALVATLYCSRLTTVPVCGEESRWANAAREMIASGDWIVTRQQGQVFPERPPLGSWAMALVGLVRGEVDLQAVRLPSALAILATSVLVYWYARGFLTQLGAMAAASVFATMGQVLQIGRLGESEAVFCCLLSGALLLWHGGYARRWPATVIWIVGYGLAALAALDKGPHAPVYFVVVCSVYLVLQRDWRSLLSWQHALGIAVFLLAIGAWQIPFWQATNWQCTRDVWSGLASDRLRLSGLLRHVLSYPLETLGCLLPWSPLLIAFVDRRFWPALSGQRRWLIFLGTAIAVTYPTVWFSAGARGRYYMPLYPLIAVAIGLVIDRSSASDAPLVSRRGWQLYWRVLAVVVAATGATIAFASLGLVARFDPIRQPPAFALFFTAAAVGAGGLLWFCSGSLTPVRTKCALLTLCAFCGLAHVGVAVNSRLSISNDLTPQINALKQLQPDAARLVSFGPAPHRFCYFYGQPIRELPWPEATEQLPADVDYFCYEVHVGDTPEQRMNGRGRYYSTTPGTLPFRWEQVAVLPCDPLRKSNPETHVMIGRVLRDIPLSTATAPLEPVRR